jgi:fatty acid amide hydrolase
MTALDPRVPPLPWQDPAAIEVEKLRVGTYVDDGVLKASPAVARAVEAAASALRARGCQVVPFDPPDVRSLVSAYLGAMSADGGTALLESLSGGAVDPVLEPMRRLAPVPVPVRRVAARVARAVGQPNFALMLGSMGEKTVSELWQLTDRLRTYRTALLEAMDRHRLDVLVCPPAATAAWPHGAAKNFTLASSYAILFNATQMPAGVVPVARVRPDETARPAGRDRIERHAADVEAKAAGLPVGVQVAGRPWGDSRVLAAMRAIEAEVSRSPEFPRTPVEVGA